MKKKTFRRACFVQGRTAFELSCFYRSDFMQRSLFSHLVLEVVENGRCVVREEIHPWQCKFNFFSMMRRALSLCPYEKTYHVKN